MGEVIPFVPRNSTIRKPMTEPRCHDDLTGGSVLDYTQLCNAYDTEFGGPNARLGFVAPESDPA